MNEWFTPSIVISIGSFLAACAGSFAVVRYQVNELKASIADLRRDMVMRGEYEASLAAVRSQLDQVVTGVNRLTDRMDRFLDAQRNDR